LCNTDPGVQRTPQRHYASKPRAQIAVERRSTQEALALVAQWIERRVPKPGVAGPIPAEGTSSELVMHDQIARNRYDRQAEPCRDDPEQDRRHSDRCHTSLRPARRRSRRLDCCTSLLAEAPPRVSSQHQRTDEGSGVRQPSTIPLRSLHAEAKGTVYEPERRRSGSVGRSSWMEPDR
jgi:hypothetical protein